MELPLRLELSVSGLQDQCITSYAKVALVYNGHIKAIYQRQSKIYRPEMMLLKNE